MCSNKLFFKLVVQLFYYTTHWRNFDILRFIDQPKVRMTPFIAPSLITREKTNKLGLVSKLRKTKMIYAISGQSVDGVALLSAETCSIHKQSTIPKKRKQISWEWWRWREPRKIDCREWARGLRRGWFPKIVKHCWGMRLKSIIKCISANAVVMSVNKIKISTMNKFIKARGWPLRGICIKYDEEEPIGPIYPSKSINRRDDIVMEGSDPKGFPSILMIIVRVIKRKFFFRWYLHFFNLPFTIWVNSWC